MCLMWKDLQRELSCKFDNIAKAADYTRGKRLRYCEAYVYESDCYIILRSYSTIVAIFDVYTNELIVRGYYSATTQQHIAKFQSDYLGAYVFRRNCYIDSKGCIEYITNDSFSSPAKVDSKGRVYNRFNGKKVYVG